MRTFNLRLVLWLAGVFIVTVIVVHFLHDYQVRRNAGVYLELATQKAAIVWDAKTDGEAKKKSEIEKAAADALQHYQRYLAMDPTNVAVRADYGRLLAHVGALLRAYLQLERVLREDETNDEMRILQVDVAIRLGRFADAESQLDVLLKKVEGKERAPLLEQRGICQVQRRKHDDALKSFSAAIAISPDRLSTYRLKAALLIDRLRNTEEANKTIDAMVEANLEFADAHLMYARFVLEGKSLMKAEERLPTATKACNTALELDPQHAEGLALAALCEQQGGRFAEAIDMLRKSLSIQPDVAKRYLQLASVELLAKRAAPAAAIDAAIGAIREGLMAIPDKIATFELRWRLVDLLIGKENQTAPESAELVTLRAELQQEQPDSPLIAYLNARQLLEDKKWIEAQRVLEANRGKLASWPDLQTKTDEMLGLCSTRTGNPDLQLTTARRLLDKSPLDVEARRGHAEALADTGQLAEAIGEYEQILRLVTEKSVDAPDAFFRRYFFLKLVEMGQRPKDQRDWAPLKLILDEAATKAPNDPWVPLMSADISMVEEHLEAARLTLETAAKTMGNEQFLLMALVDVAQRQNDNEEAARRLAEIEKIFGDTIGTRLAKARFLIHQKGQESLPHLADLIKDLDKLPAAEQEPEQLAQLHWQLAQLCWSQQDAALGRQYGRQAAELSPSNVQFRLLLLRNAQLAQDVDAARQLSGEIQSIDNGGALTLYSQAVYDFTRYLADKARGKDGAATLSEARDKLRQAQPLRPTWVLVPLLLGDIAREQKDDDAALGYYQRAMELGNRDAETCAQVAIIMYRRGRFDEADAVVKTFEQQQNTTTPEMGRLASRISYSRSDLERALVMAKLSVEQTQTPQLNDVLFLGQLYATHGQFANAQLTFQKAIDLEPTDETAYLAMVQLLVAASKQAESSAEPNDAERLFADAKAKMAEAEQQVEPSKRAQTVAHCLDFLGQPDLAVQKFEQAINDAPQDTVLLQAATRFYVNYPQFRGKAQPILEQFVAGKLTDDTNVLAWARRELARVLKSSGGYQNFLTARTLIDTNLQADPVSAEDLELQARLLSSRLLPSLEKEAVKLLERQVALPQPAGLETKYFLAQRYLSLGLWAKARELMADVIVKADNSNSRGRLPAYLRTHVTALLDHDEVSEAKRWAAKLKSVKPKALETAMLEAKTLGPPKSKSPARNAVAPLYNVTDALQVLKNAVEDRDVHALLTKNANETDDEYARRDTDAKKAVVVAVLDDFLQQMAKSGAPADTNRLRATIDQYDAEIIANDPGRTLTRVPYLVRQGRRNEAVELTTKKENWETAQFWTLFTACETVLTDLEKQLLAADAHEIGTPVSSGEETTAILAEEVRSQSAAMEAMLQNVLVKYRRELEAAQAADQDEKHNAVAAILSLLANHDFNTGHADPQRYRRAGALYTEILAMQPGNVEAISNRAKILEANGESLGTSLDQINRALASNGPLPMVLDAQATILLASGKPQEALEAAVQVIREKPARVDAATDAELAKNWGSYYFHLALVYDANRDTAEAIKALQKAVKLGFGDTDVFALERPKWTSLVKKLGI